MAQKDGKSKREEFWEALSGKSIPVLTLDNKWYRLLDELGRNSVKEYEEQLNTLLKRQGKINGEIRDIKRIKKKLMGEIVPMVDEAGDEGSAQIEKRIEENKRLIAECNQKLEVSQDELKDMPGAIRDMNFQLMLKTMEYCYDEIQENTEQIAEIEEWVTQIRIELKKRLIQKQSMEEMNHRIYGYMHDIFGAEVIDLFDITYDPEKKHPKNARKDESEKTEG